MDEKSRQSGSKMKKRPDDICIFCGFVGKLSKEHILPHWMRPHLPAYEGLSLEGKLFRRDAETGQELHPEIESRKGSGEHRSQTLRVVCTDCNNGWMSQIVEDGKPAIEPLMLGQWENLSDEVQHKIATWFALHNMVYERSWEYLQVTPDMDRRNFMVDHDPGPYRFIWIARIVDDSAMPTFARFMGSGEPGPSSKMTLVIAAAAGKVAFLSIYDPSHIIEKERMQKIEALLNPWALRIWPPTVNPKPPQATLVAESLDEFLKEIEQIIGGGESKLAKALPEAMEWAMESIKRQMAEGTWPPKVS